MLFQTNEMEERQQIAKHEKRPQENESSGRHDDSVGGADCWQWQIGGVEGRRRSGRQGAK